MTTAWTEALYRRVLMLVSFEELHSSSNRVLQEEFFALDEVVNDVLSAFAKLEEVRDAVSKLEQASASTGGRSASLVTAMESTLAVRQQLETRLQNIGVISKNSVLEERKHKRKHQERNRLSIKTATDAATATQSGEEFESGGQSEGGHQLARIEAKGKSSTINLTPRTKGSKNSSRVRKKQCEVTRRQSVEAKPPGYYMSRVKEVDALPPIERSSCIPELLRELTVSLAKDNSYGQRFRFTSYLKDMIRWVTEMTGQKQHLDLFLAFAESVKVFANKLPNSDQTLGLLRCANLL